MKMNCSMGQEKKMKAKKRHRKNPGMLAAGLLFLLIPQAAPGEDTLRNWGFEEKEETISGRLLWLYSQSIHVETPEHPRGLLLPLENLRPQDQEYVETRRAELRQRLEDPPSLAWPRQVRVGRDYRFTTITSDPSSETFVYQSNHFAFHSDVPLSPRVIREFGQVFEATYLAVQAMPLDWHPRPPPEGHFKVLLFARRDDYYEAGGLPHTGGIYDPRRRTILVPLSSLGLERLGSAWTFSGDSDFRVLRHEVTHQVHHHWLSRLPIWLTEGLALYVESLPYSRGTLRFEQQSLLENYLHRVQRDRRFTPLEQMLTMDTAEWNRVLTEDPEEAAYHYATALLMAWFFFHLFEEGEPLYRYLRAIESGYAEKEARPYLFDHRNIEELTGEFIRQFDLQDLRLRERGEDP